MFAVCLFLNQLRYLCATFWRLGECGLDFVVVVVVVWPSARMLVSMTIVLGMMRISIGEVMILMRLWFENQILGIFISRLYLTALG